ncbi:MAG: aminotransferase class V-fold PLP-dependent enzyme [Sphingomonadales bacterium]|nr:aminotransferase class V-fold PLP-dependent enzyme [Sphingomonadales bacterium]
MANLLSDTFKSDYVLPKVGCSRESIDKKLKEILAKDPEEKFAAMATYCHKGSQDVQDVLLQAFSKVFQKNNLITVMMPGQKQIEEELLSMCANLLSGGVEGVVANISSGGTESIFSGVHAAREWAREKKPHIIEPEFIAPYSGHATLNKAGHYLGIKIKRVPVGKDFRGDIAAIRKAIGPNTIGLYASAPNWPYGTYDPIREFGQLALEHDLWLHVDACVGGFIAPFAKKLGYKIPDWDFSVPGVMSISADLHKHAYAMKPASVIAWRSIDLLKYHYVRVTEWPTMEYASQGFVGSRSSGPVAAAWALLHFLGEDGYLEFTKRTMENKRRLIEGIEKIPGLKIIDNELSILCYVSQDEALPILAILGGMTALGWLHFGTMEPPMIQLILDPRADQFIDAYLKDLAQIAARVRAGETFDEGELRYAN